MHAATADANTVGRAGASAPGTNVPVASASSLPSRAAIAAPRKPTHSVRC